MDERSLELGSGGGSARVAVIPLVPLGTSSRVSVAPRPVDPGRVVFSPQIRRRIMS